MTQESEEFAARIEKLTDRICESIRKVGDRRIDVVLDGKAVARAINKSYLADLAKHGTTPLPAVIEIMEKTPHSDPMVVVPNEVRINGQSILCPDGSIVKIADMGSNDAVKVTVTMFASRVTIGHEPKTDG